MRATLLLVAMMVAGAGPLACGSNREGVTGAGVDASGITCPSSAACGGSVVGTWSIVQACNFQTVKTMGCAQETYTSSNEAMTGTLVFGADGTLTETVTTTGTITDMFPPACLTGTTCADIEAGYRQVTFYKSVSCADDAGTCVCTLMFETTSSSSHMYATSGSTLTVSNGPASGGAFCVAGSTLTITSLGTAWGPAMGFVLARQ